MNLYILEIFRTNHLSKIIYFNITRVIDVKGKKFDKL